MSQLRPFWIERARGTRAPIQQGPLRDAINSYKQLLIAMPQSLFLGRSSLRCAVPPKGSAGRFARAGNELCLSHWVAVRIIHAVCWVCVSPLVTFVYCFCGSRRSMHTSVSSATHALRVHVLYYDIMMHCNIT